MLRQTAHPTESRYEILGLFTTPMIAASMIVVAVGALLPFVQSVSRGYHSHLDTDHGAAVGSHAILFFFKPQERGLAMDVRQMGMPLGGVMGAIVIAIAADYFGYRGALIVSGIIVLVVTLGAAALYREPSASMESRYARAFF